MLSYVTTLSLRREAMANLRASIVISITIARGVQRFTVCPQWMRWTPVNICRQGTAVEVWWLDSIRHEHFTLGAEPVCRLRDLKLPPRSRCKLRAFWFITQPVVVVSYRRFGTACRVHLQGSRSRVMNLTIEDGTDSFARNVNKKLPILTA